MNELGFFPDVFFLMASLFISECSGEKMQKTKNYLMDSSMDFHYGLNYIKFINFHAFVCGWYLGHEHLFIGRMQRRMQGLECKKT